MMHFHEFDWDELYQIISENHIISQIFFALSMVSNFYKDLDIDFFLERIKPQVELYILEKITDGWEKLFIRCQIQNK